MNATDKPWVPESIWLARLVSHGRVLRTVCVHNDLLSAGRRDATSQITGLKPPGVFKWVELGTSSQPTEPARDSGCVSPILKPNGDHFRAEGSWSRTGSDFTLDLSVPGTTITGNVREAALFPSENQGLGSALFRIVFPAVLPLDSNNTLVLSIFLSP